MLRINMVLCILFNMIELSSRIRIFSYFAYFVAQLINIIVDAMPLGAMLAFIIVSQTVLFWILDQNSIEAKYEGMTGFGNVLIDSYRLSLGDFEITGNFVDNTNNIMIFWTVFFISTLIAMLVILNMVIAVMGNTYNRVAEE